MPALTLSALRAVLSDPAAFRVPDPSVRRAIRDLHFDVTAGLLGPSERTLLEQLVHACSIPTVTVDALSVCCGPSQQRTMLRYVPASSIPEASRSDFARPIPGMPSLAAVFIDPRELHFGNFESILPLDVLFEGVPTTLSLRDRRPLGGLPDAWTFRVEAPAPLKAALAKLDGLNLYAPPLETGGRRGERLLFHAAALSDAIGAAARAALPEAARDGLSHANVVLRCSRFQPDEPFAFADHYDTPYSDTSIRQVSRYTVLVYLTGGRGAPALRLGDTVLEEIEPMTAVIFHHRHRHASGPFAGGPKVFLRTELVYESDMLGYDPLVAQQFAQACYLVGYSRDNLALAARMRAMFDAVAAARWGLPVGELRPVWWHKSHTTLPMTFLCNGYDYWFRGEHAPASCAVTAVLDFFNAEAPRHLQFRWMCSENKIEPGEGTAWILAALEAGEEPVTPLSLSNLLEPPGAPSGQEACCPDHDRATFQPHRDKDVINLLEERQQAVRDTLGGAPVLILGGEVFFRPERVVVGQRHIYLLADAALGRVNFAGGWSPPCWTTCVPGDFIEAEEELDGLVLLVPPITFERVDGCLHLMFDYFRSGWLSSWGLTEEVSVPRLGS